MTEGPPCRSPRGPGPRAHRKVQPTQQIAFSFLSLVAVVGALLASHPNQTLVSVVVVSDPAAAAMPFTPGPYSGVSTLALVARVSALGIGVAYGTIKLGVLKATKPSKKEDAAAHH